MLGRLDSGLLVLPSLLDDLPIRACQRCAAAERVNEPMRMMSNFFMMNSFMGWRVDCQHAH